MAELFTERSDKELLQRCREGDEKAFNVLFRRHIDGLLQFATQRLNKRELAEEVVMDVMLKLWQKSETENEIEQLDQYLFRSVKNKIISHWRKKALELAPIDQVPEARIPWGIPSDSRLSTQETETIYRDSLAKLSPQRRLVYVLSREENLSNAEIAAVTRLSIHTVKNHLKASLLHFRKYLRNYVETEMILVIGSIFFLFR